MVVEGLAFFRLHFFGWLGQAVPALVITTSLAMYGWYYLYAAANQLMSADGKFDLATHSYDDMIIHVGIRIFGLFLIISMCVLVQKYLFTRHFLLKSMPSAVIERGNFSGYFWNVVFIHFLNAIAGIPAAVILPKGILLTLCSGLIGLFIDAKFFFMPPFAASGMKKSLSASWQKTAGHYWPIFSGALVSYLLSFSLLTLIFTAMGWLSFGGVRLGISSAWPRWLIISIGSGLSLTLCTGLLAAFQAVAVKKFAPLSFDAYNPS